jgi:hypothetical protein
MPWLLLPCCNSRDTNVMSMRKSIMHVLPPSTPSQSGNTAALMPHVHGCGEARFLPRRLWPAMSSKFCCIQLPAKYKCWVMAMFGTSLLCFDRLMLFYFFTCSIINWLHLKVLINYLHTRLFLLCYCCHSQNRLLESRDTYRCCQTICTVC